LNCEGITIKADTLERYAIAAGLIRAQGFLIASLRFPVQEALDN
jgi:hypothetical protein